jgi:hypothetical protein
VRPNRYNPKDASLVGVLQCPKGASEVAPFGSYVASPPSSWTDYNAKDNGTLLFTWGARMDDTMYSGPYMKNVCPKSPFIKYVFHKDQNKKITPLNNWIKGTAQSQQHTAHGHNSASTLRQK